MTADLAAFLRAREDEREQVALDRGSGTEVDGLSSAGHDRDCARAMVNQARLGGHPLSETQAKHLLSIGYVRGLHAPERVLAEVEAKRRIIDLHEGSHECSTFEDNCTWIDGDIRPWCDTLKLLALPHAGHEGYRAEWKP